MAKSAKRIANKKVIWDHLVKYRHVRVHDLIYDHGITRASARIKELREMIEHNKLSCSIETIRGGVDELCTYQLVGDPNQIALL